MREAQVAIEDHRFYDHGGIDIQGTARAVISNLRNGSSVGASSLTQQYVKISLQYSALSSGNEEAAAEAVKKDYMRKLKELKYAITLEKKLTKDQILEGYLNLVYYGDRAYGVEAAAQHYFSVPASKLSLSQAALLAGLTQNPGTTDPVNFPKKAVARRNVVLDRMHELGRITDKQWQAAKKRTLKQDMRVTQPKSTCLASPYPYWCDFIVNYALAMPQLGKTVEERKRTLYRGGVTITTTLDPKLQDYAQKEITKKVPIGNKARIGSAAYVADPNTGKVLAFAQNTSYSVSKDAGGETGINWALDKKYGGSGGFQFGSTAKAFALVTAMQSGMNTKSSVDAKAAGGESKATYTPKEWPGGTANCGPGEHVEGPQRHPVQGRQDLAHGGDGAVDQHRVRRPRRAARRLQGPRHDDPPRPAPRRRPDDRQVRPAVHPRWRRRLPAGRGARLRRRSPRTARSARWSPSRRSRRAARTSPCRRRSATRSSSPTSPRATDKFLEYNMTHGSGIRNQLDDGNRESAGKTGTANNNNESWFVGYTPQLVTAVWVGTPYDPVTRVMKNVRVGGEFYPVMHGAAIAAPIWKAIMNKALDGQPEVKFGEPSDKPARHGRPGRLPSVPGMSVGPTPSDAPGGRLLRAASAGR